MIRVIVIPYLVAPADHRIEYEVRWRLGLTAGDAIGRAREHLSKLGIEEIHISCQGYDCTPIQELQPGDMVIVSAYHGIQGLIWIGLMKLGMYGAALNIASAVIAGALTIGAGLLLTSIMSPTVSSQKGEKPTYGWDGPRNMSQPGNPVPVSYGTCWSAPHLIGARREVDAEYNMWQYLLFSVGAGKTNNPITVDRVLVGDEALESFENYQFSVTDGDTTITAETEAALALFPDTTHDRIFERRLRYDPRANAQGIQLLNFNTDFPVKEWTALTSVGLGNIVVPTSEHGYFGRCYICVTAGDTAATEPTLWPITIDETIADGTATWQCKDFAEIPTIDASGRNSPWAPQGGATIEMDTPKWGAGYLHLASSAHLVTDDLEVLLMSRPVQFEGWLRLPSLDDRILFFAESTMSEGSITTVARTMFGYIGGKFRLQNAKVEYEGSSPPGNVDDMQWSIMADISTPSTSPTLNAWRYLRFYVTSGQERSYGGEAGPSTVIDGGKYVLQVENDSGVLEELVVGGDFFIENNDNWLGNEATAYASLTNKDKYLSFIGRGKYVNASGTATELYGVCDLDCVRITRGAAYDQDDETIPDAEITVNAEASFADAFVIETKSKCDRLRIIIEFKSGLGHQNKEGKIESQSVDFALNYRKRGVETWTTSEITCSASRVTSIPRFQFDLTFPSRDLYDVLVYRESADHDDSLTTKDTSTLTSFQERIDLFQCYPGMQAMAVGLKASEQASGQIGTITVKNERTEIYVPTWDNESTMAVNPSIPAWQMYDACTNRLYGIRQTPADLKRTAFEDWRDWTEGLVVGNRRAACNIVYDEPSNFGDGFLKHIEQSGRVRTVREGALWKPVVDKPRLPQYVFSAGNILMASKGSKESSCSWSGYDETEKVDAVSVTYWDAEKRGRRRTTPLIKTSWYESLDRLPKVQNLELRGCNNEDEALRYGRFCVNKNEYIGMHGKHKSGHQAAGIEFGEVFTLLPSSHRALWGGNLRKDHVDANTLYLNGTMTFSAAEYRDSLYLFAVGPQGEYYKYIVDGPWDEETSSVDVRRVTMTLDEETGRLIEVITGEGHTGNRGDAVGLGRPTSDRITQQITKVSHDFAAREVHFEWCEYSENVFYHTDWEGGRIPI